MGRISATEPLARAKQPKQLPAWERNAAETGRRIVHFGEIFVVAAAGVLVLTAIFVAAITLFELVFDGVRRNIGSIESISELQTAVQAVFAGVLLLMLGLELLETLKSYFTDSHLRIEIILVVALIAVSRHVMLIDVQHASGAELIGSSALTLSLAASYWLVRSRRTGRDSSQAD
jgi:uncharacterized membrane protein (DUF373 family)